MQLSRGWLMGRIKIFLFRLLIESYITLRPLAEFLRKTTPNDFFFIYKKLTKLLETKVEDSDCNMYLPKPRGSVGELPSSSFRTTQVLPGSTDGLRVESVGLVVITSPLSQLSGFFNCKLIICGSFSGQRNNKNRWRKKGDTFPLRNLWRDRL